MRIASFAFCTAIAVMSCYTAAEEINNHDEPKKMVISCPIVSMRVEPKEYIAGQEPDEQASRAMFGRFYERFRELLRPAFRDPLQDTQLLYNESILCLQELPDDWLKIEALEQYFFDKKEQKWKHVQGYIKKNQAIAVNNFLAPTIVVCKATAKVNCFYECSITIPIGTKLQGIETLQNNYRVTLLDKKKGYIEDHDVRPMIKLSEGSDKLRASIAADAKELLGSSYNWGGRSNNCDCSGFINEIYRCNSLEIPRNVRCMYLKCNKIEHGSELLPGDLIFLALAERPENFNHILMYMGDDQVIECCSAKGVVISPAQERLSKSLAKLNFGDPIKAGMGYTADYVVAFGSLLDDPALVRELNDYALGNYAL